MNDCLFCQFATSNTEFLYENESFYVRYDAFPVSPGHAIIVPKNHVVGLLDLDSDQWVKLQVALKEVTRIIQNQDKQKLYADLLKRHIDDRSTKYYELMLNHVGIDKTPDAFNYGNNDGEAAGRTIHHLHIHIIPRYFGDIPQARGGIRNIIPGLGDYTSKT